MKFRAAIGFAAALIASSAGADVTYTFDANGQGFTSEFISAPFDGPWVYSANSGVGGSGGWLTEGQVAEVQHPCTADLVSPEYVVTREGSLRLRFDHRYSFEYDGTVWDGGAVLVSVNGGAATLVPLTAFVQGGYNGFVASNSHADLAGKDAFAAKSPGYDSGAFVTSIADLGRFVPGDKVRVRFRFSGDTNTSGGSPDWAIDNLSFLEGLAGSGLTYQGVLRGPSGPLTGPVNLRLSLYSSPTSAVGTSLVAVPITQNSVALGAGGVFSTLVDFGPGSFDENARWVEVEAMIDGQWVRMLPRTPLTPAPQSVFAASAAHTPWSGLTGALPAVLPPWNAASGGISYKGGNVAIGSSVPSATLHVTSAEPTDQFKVSAAPNAPFGAFLGLDATATAGGHKWVMFSSGGTASEGPGKLIFRDLTSSAFGVTMDNLGRVGVNNTAPETTFEVYGSVGVGNGDGGVLYARNSEGAMEPWMYPRWSDNTTYTNFGSNGWRIRSNALQDVLAMLPNGNVGVGTATPAMALHVVRNGNTWPHAQIESNSNTGTWFNLYNASAGGSYWRFISTGSSNGEGAGKLLIGFGPSATGQSTVLTMQQNGNVGIGTSTPSQRLTVAGNVLANNVAVPSSIRFKDHVSTMNDALAGLLKLEGVRFDWKPEWAAQRPGREHDIGFVAEDVAKVFPEVVFYDDQGNVTGMDYSRLTAVAVQAIKQQQGQRETDRRAIDRLESENKELRSRLERLEAAIERR
ncbi:MAG: tail fiber domain-containing protein [Phycisphaerales bacterium]